MNDSLNESLSALMDGEASDFETRRLLTELEPDSPLRAAWWRLHLARDALAGEVSSRPMDISHAVSSAIAREAAPRPALFTEGLRRSLGSFAIAATVTAVAVLGGQQLLDADSAASGPAVTSPVGLVDTLGGTPVRASFGSASAPVLQPSVSTAYRELARQRFTRYAQQHAEQAALNTPHGLLPFARVPEIAR